MEFNRIALLKLNELIKREGFIKVGFVDQAVVRIEYLDRSCSITNFGKVNWYKN